jgi:type I restriction enzyme M protein
MLDNGTKRRIDNARDILVGKIPDPKTQVEQITFALLYKFMDDMDQLSVNMGGKASFFSNGYEQYTWSHLMDKRLSGLERMDLYVRALDQMSQNPNIPPLFRSIFKGAFLPYRDSETLNLFLKEINEFSYTHSEDLGDAYEYLLSIFGSQGAAGQFRTPRHIIDFIVECVDPDKNDTILDPACGTAGFLISAYKHILKKYKDTPLTPDEKERLTNNFTGYDISPDMVRLSLMNMYLHQFPNPTIFEYDTLTTDDRWDDNFDVIMANPPFMTPKGGIRPHKRFAVRANRSEVLFVDYIAEHLKPGGRAGVIVPEGIIFQTNNAYKALRKMLVEENYLYAVISLPAGVFKPYSGVKTSILLMDKDFAKQLDSVLFIKVEADGFDLGDQRRPIEANDLPKALEIIKSFKDDPFSFSSNDRQANLVNKKRLAEYGDYSLNMERYKDNNKIANKWPLVPLGDKNFFKIESGGTPDTNVPEFWNGNIPWVTFIDLPQENLISHIKNSKRRISQQGLLNSSAKLLPTGTVLVTSRATIGRIAINDIELATNQGFKNIIILDKTKINETYLALILTTLKEKMNELGSGGTYKEISRSSLAQLEIPLPPIEVQQEIVAEIEGYQKVIDGARQVVENYKPYIPIDPSWKIMALKDICQIKKGTAITKSQTIEGKIPVIAGGKEPAYFHNVSNREGNIITISASGAYAGFVNFFPFPIFASDCTTVRSMDENTVSTYFIYLLLKKLQAKIYSLRSGMAQPHVYPKDLEKLMVPVPPYKLQSEIIEENNNIQKIIDGNTILINHLQNKISGIIQGVWEAI